jgi:hypothetical protein
MNLYFIAATNADGESRDQFVIAESVDEAVAIWESDYGIDEIEPTDRDEYDEPKFVFKVDMELIRRIDKARSLDWHGVHIPRVGGNQTYR